MNIHHFEYKSSSSTGLIRDKNKTGPPEGSPSGGFWFAQSLVTVVKDFVTVETFPVCSIAVL